MNTTMKNMHLILAAACLATSLTPALAAPKEPTKPQPVAAASALTPEERERLAAARKVAADNPEVAAAYEQAKSDKSAARKAYLDYKSTRERAASSEEAWRRLNDTALAKADPSASALVEKEKAAFRARMAASRPEAKKGQRPAVKVAEDDGDDAGSEDPQG